MAIILILLMTVVINYRDYLILVASTPTDPV